jgi:hypothetical protein
VEAVNPVFENEVPVPVVVATNENEVQPEPLQRCT